MRSAPFGTGTAHVDLNDRTFVIDFDYDLEEFGCGVASLGMEADDGDEISDAEEAAVIREIEDQLRHGPQLDWDD